MTPKKSIYLINGLIPSDEEAVFYISVFLLVEIGSKKVCKYYWVNITNGSGIGFATDTPGYPDERTALLEIHKFTEKHFNLGEYSFEEMLNVKNEMASSLETIVNGNKDCVKS